MDALNDSQAHDEQGGPKSSVRRVGGVEIPAPPPGHGLKTQGLRLYDWICVALVEDGRQIRAAGIQIVMLVHTFTAWVDDMKLVVELGRYGTSETGNRYELPHSYNERNGRSEIKRDLPEACLTVMSQVEARLKESKMGGGGQDDLWPELIEHATSSPAVKSKH